MSSTITAQFIVRFSGFDEDVTIRCEDDPDSMSHQLAVRPTDDVVELRALDGWTSSNGVPATLDELGFKEYAGSALAESGLSPKWEIETVMVRPGHGSQNGGWVDESDPVAAVNLYTSCAIRLKQTAMPAPYFETANVGGLVVCIDYWISLNIA